jgi:hypothetical protein
MTFTTPTTIKSETTPHEPSPITGIFQQMLDRWPSQIVARTEIETFTGGLVKEKSLANLDSDKKGPVGRFRIGRKIGYPAQAVVAWLQARSKPVTDDRYQHLQKANRRKRKSNAIK